MSDFGQPCRWCAVHDVQSPRAAEDEDAPGEEGGEHDPEALQAFLEADSALDAQGKLDDAIKQCKVGNSFLPDTRVLMADGGAVPIEDVAAGDEVLAFDPLTGTEGPREVTGTISGSGAKTLVDVAVDDGRGDAAAVTATDGHPFWTPEGAGWTEAEGLLPGTRLRASSGTWPQVTGVEVRDVPDRRVHNLTVEGLHTYYVLAGATPVLVHDADDLCGVTSAIHDDPYLVKAAEAAGRNQRLQKEMDDLVMQFRSGNKNPGLGNKALEGTDISYLRGRNGGRVFIPEHRRRDPDRRQGGQIEREQGHQPSQGALRKLTMYEISENGLTLRVELGGDEPDEVENADGWVLVPGGGEWSATFLTHREMGRVMERWRSTGECLGGAYFTCPDLVVTRRPGVREMFAAVRDMVANGDHETTLRRIG